MEMTGSMKSDTTVSYTPFASSCQIYDAHHISCHGGKLGTGILYISDVIFSFTFQFLLPDVPRRLLGIFHQYDCRYSLTASHLADIKPVPAANQW